MERAKKLTDDLNTNRALEFIFQNAFGLPIIFSSVPTNAQMKANTWGIQGTDLYVKFGNNVTLKFTGTNVA